MRQGHLFDGIPRATNSRYRRRARKDMKTDFTSSTCVKNKVTRCHYSRCGTHNLLLGFAIWVAHMIRDHMAEDPRAGFVYAGTVKEGPCSTAIGLLKVGKTRRCPLCRMSEQGLEPVAAAFDHDVDNYERELLAALGVPTWKAEYFDQGNRVDYLLGNGLLHSIASINDGYAAARETSGLQSTPEPGIV